MIYLLAQEYAQTEYGLGYGLIALFIFLGVLMIALPRPRKASIFEEDKKKKRKKKKR